MVGVFGSIKESLGGGSDDSSLGDEMLVEFDSTNVSRADDHDLGYYGSYTYEDDDGTRHRIQRKYEVYTPDDEDTKPTVEVSEEHVIVDKADGDGDIVDSREFEPTAEVNPALTGIAYKNRIQTFVKSWHQENTERR